MDIALYDNWDDIVTDYDKIKEYCYFDCVSTLLLVHKTQLGLASIADNLGMPYNLEFLNSKHTASSLGWTFFIQGFLCKNIVNGEEESTDKVIYNN